MAYLSRTYPAHDRCARCGAIIHEVNMLDHVARHEIADVHAKATRERYDRLIADTEAFIAQNPALFRRDV